MHPAYSVIFFTTASGAGYGLLALLGPAAGRGHVHPDLWLGLVGLGLAFGLIGSGLLSSTGHRGHKARAWRAATFLPLAWLHPGISRTVLSVLAPMSRLSRVLVERWLFFAEAGHTVTLDYGRA